MRIVVGPHSHFRPVFLFFSVPLYNLLFVSQRLSLWFTAFLAFSHPFSPSLPLSYIRSFLLSLSLIHSVSMSLHLTPSPFFNILSTLSLSLSLPSVSFSLVFHTVVSSFSLYLSLSPSLPFCLCLCLPLFLSVSFIHALSSSLSFASNLPPLSLSLSCVHCDVVMSGGTVVAVVVEVVLDVVVVVGLVVPVVVVKVVKPTVAAGPVTLTGIGRAAATHGTVGSTATSVVFHICDWWANSAVSSPTRMTPSSCALKTFSSSWV